MVGRGKKSLDLGFENFVRVVIPSYFAIVVQTHSRLPYYFLTQLFLQVVGRKKEFMKLNIGNVLAI